MDRNKKIQVNNILLILCICLLVNFITIIFLTNNRIFTSSQTQNVNINTEKKDKIDLNKASKEQLASLPAIGETKANLIVNNRPYENIWDLSKIKGIGDDTIRALEKEVEVK